MKKKIIYKVIFGVVLFVFGVILLEKLTSYTTTSAGTVKEIDGTIYIDTSIGTSMGYIVETNLIEVEKGVYKIENRCNILYGNEGAGSISVDNKDGHIKEIRSYREDYPNGYRIVYPVQDHELFDIEKISMIVEEKDKEVQSYVFKASHNVNEIVSKIHDYMVSDNFVETKVIDLNDNTSYTVVVRCYDGQEYRYKFVEGYLVYENMNYVYKVDNYDEMINYLKGKFELS